MNFIRTEHGRIPAIPTGTKISTIKWIVGKWRMLFKFCPECNSSAPHCDTCEVCHDNREAFYRFKEFKRLWWNRYVLKSAGIQTKFDFESIEITDY